MPMEEVRNLSARICAVIQNSAEYQKAQTLCFYYPLGQEVNLSALAEECLRNGKSVAFPKVHGDDMAFYQVQSLTELRAGCFHVMEPTSEKRVTWEQALVLTPGLVFDTQGSRIGYGKGYYDRYFGQYPHLIRIGIAYASQIEAAIESEPQDIKMHEIVTENGFIHGKN